MLRFKRLQLTTFIILQLTLSACLPDTIKNPKSSTLGADKITPNAIVSNFPKENADETARAIQNLTDKKEIKLALAFQSFAQQPTATNSKMFCDALVAHLMPDAKAIKLSFGGFFESDPFAKLSINWINQIDKGDLSAITALWVYHQVISLDGAEESTVQMLKEKVHTRNTVIKAKAQLACREYFATHEMFKTQSNGCLD